MAVVVYRAGGSRDTPLVEVEAREHALEAQPQALEAAKPQQLVL